MADNVDKSLPNTRSEVKIPSQEEITEKVQEKVTEEVTAPDGVETIQNEDGSVDVNFDPRAVAPAEGDEHYSNLAEFLGDEILDPLGTQLQTNFEEYKESRRDWERTYTQGLDLLGFKYEDKTEPFQNASGATHPVLAEAVTQFQALAYKELLPAEGPVRTAVVGKITPEKTQQAERVKDYMNYELMEKMPEFEPDFDQLLFYLPLAGSAFKKTYYDELMNRAVSKFVPADDLVVPYTATSLDDAEAIVHVLKMDENTLRKQQVAGFYRDIDLGTPTDNATTTSDLKAKERELEGIRKTKQENVFTLLEVHTDLDLEGYEDKDMDGNPTGIKLPYIVTLEEATRSILSIRRNYEIGDPNKSRIKYFTHFKFLPGLGFYGLGLIHMIGGLSRTATQALRQLLDAGTLSNLPAGFKQRGIRIRDDAQSIQPGEFRDVDAPGGNIKDSFMMLPFKEPSQTLLQLMGVVVQAGQRFASIADLQVGEGNQQAAVGTTVALLERGSRTMSAIHKRLYASLKSEFRLLARVYKLYLPPEYPYDVVGGSRTVKQADFDDRVDILPVADPNIFSQTQRISLAQTELQLAVSNPQVHNVYQAYRNMYEALGVKDIDLLLKKPQPPMPKDPALEHIDAMAGKPFQAFPGQDHRAHITAHLNFLATNLVQNSPMMVASIEKNIMEHISLMAQEQIEIEFAQELQTVAMMQQQIQQNPQLQPQLMNVMQKIESRKAVLIAEMMAEFKKEDSEINGGLGADPLTKLKARELDLRAAENQRRAEDDEERINLDRMKAMMNQANFQQKLDQTEDLAELRAATSLTKQEMSTAGKKFDFGRNFPKK